VVQLPCTALTWLVGRKGSCRTRFPIFFCAPGHSCKRPRATAATSRRQRGRLVRAATRSASPGHRGHLHDKRALRQCRPAPITAFTGSPSLRNCSMMRVIRMRWLHQRTKTAAPWCPTPTRRSPPEGLVRAKGSAVVQPVQRGHGRPAGVDSSSAPRPADPGGSLHLFAEGPGRHAALALRGGGGVSERPRQEVAEPRYTSRGRLAASRAHHAGTTEPSTWPQMPGSSCFQPTATARPACRR